MRKERCRHRPRKSHKVRVNATPTKFKALVARITVNMTRSRSQKWEVEATAAGSAWWLVKQKIMESQSGSRPPRKQSKSEKIGRSLLKCEGEGVYLRQTHWRCQPSKWASRCGHPLSFLLQRVGSCQPRSSIPVSGEAQARAAFLVQMDMWGWLYWQEQIDVFTDVFRPCDLV